MRKNGLITLYETLLTTLAVVKWFSIWVNSFSFTFCLHVFFLLYAFNKSFFLILCINFILLVALIILKFNLLTFSFDFFTEELSMDQKSQTFSVLFTRVRSSIRYLWYIKMKMIPSKLTDLKLVRNWHFNKAGAWKKCLAYIQP